MFGYAEDLEAGIKGVDPLPIFRKVNDHTIAFPPKTQGRSHVLELPATLLDAMLAFLLVCAARRARGQCSVHNSMLIHTTHLNLVQDQVYEMTLEEVRRLKRSIAYAQDDPSDPVWSALQAKWKEDFIPTTNVIRELTKDERLSSLTWEEIRNHLHEATGRIEVRQMNGLSKEALDYSRSGLSFSVIAIGGNKLSRGLTLERIDCKLLPSSH